MWIIPFEDKIFIFERKQIFYFGIQLHGRERSHISRELFTNLIKMIGINMCISEHMDEFTWFETNHLCNHHCQECIRGDIKRYSEECIGTPLVHLTRELSIGHIELVHHMTRRKKHTVRLDWIIGHDEHAARIWILSQSLDDILYLIHSLAIKITPLIPIYRTKISPLFGEIHIDFDRCYKIYFRENLSFSFHLFLVLRVRPSIPDMNIIINQVLDIGITRKEPKKFMDNPF